MTEHMLAWRKKDLDRVEEIWSKQMPLLEYVYGNESRLHIRYKLATWIRGLMPHPFMRPPMPPPRKEEAERILTMIENSGMSHISRSEFEETLERQNVVLKRPLP